jgi:hypothetical protein
MPGVCGLWRLPTSWVLLVITWLSGFFFTNKKKRSGFIFWGCFFLKHLIILSYFLDWFSFVFLVWLLFCVHLMIFFCCNIPLISIFSTSHSTSVKLGKEKHYQIGNMWSVWSIVQVCLPLEILWFFFKRLKYEKIKI